MKKFKIIYFYLLLFSRNIPLHSSDILAMLMFIKINSNKNYLSTKLDEKNYPEFAESINLTFPLWMRKFNPQSLPHKVMFLYDITQIIIWMNKDTKEQAIKKLNQKENFLSKILIDIMENTPTHNGIKSVVNSAKYIANNIEYYTEKFSFLEMNLTFPLWMRNFNPQSLPHKAMLLYDITQIIIWMNKDTKEQAIKKLNQKENFLSKGLIDIMENTPTHNGIESVVNSAEYIANKIEYYGKKFNSNEMIIETVNRSILIRSLFLKEPTKIIQNKRILTNQLIKVISIAKNKGPYESNKLLSNKLLSKYYYESNKLLSNKLLSKYYNENTQNLLNINKEEEEKVQEINLLINSELKFFSEISSIFNQISKEEEEEEEEDTTISLNVKLSSRISSIIYQKLNNNNNNNNNNTLLKKRLI